MYPDGWHPSARSWDRQGQNRAKFSPRHKSGGVVYYFVDFGISRVYRANHEKVVDDCNGSDREVPEFETKAPYDPFPADVFILGNLYRKTFTQEYRNLEFIEPLVQRMTSKEPSARPTADDAFEWIKAFLASSKGYAPHLRWRLEPREETRSSRLFENVKFLAREEVPHVIRRVTLSPRSQKR